MAKVTRLVAESRLGDVPENKRFLCYDGETINNLRELRIALKDMSDETFNYHSNEVKSDFGNWVRDVIGDEKLSKDLRKSYNRFQAAKSVADRIAWLESKLVAK